MAGILDHACLYLILSELFYYTCKQFYWSSDCNACKYIFI